MKIEIAALTILAGSVIGLGLAAGMPEPSCVGVGQCRNCHRTSVQGRQHPLWEESLHARSFQALTTPAGLRIARDHGIDKPAEDPRCLDCHAPLHAKAPEFAAEGVTCEACHGPGSDYAKAMIMLNRERSVANGLILHLEPDAIRASCLKCHESAHGIAFDFDAAWDKIRHPIPGR